MKQNIVKDAELDSELYNYLDALLSDVPAVECVDEEASATQPVITPATSVDKLDEALIASEAVSLEADSEDKDALIDSGIFKALLFKVGDMTMLAPMAELRGVSSWPDKLTKMMGGKSCYLGMARRNGININVLDTCYLLDQGDVGDQCHDEVADYLNMILVGDGATALACHDVIDIVDVEPKKIKWRQTRKNRPWYLGVDTKKMSIMLDVSEIISAAKDE